MIRLLVPTMAVLLGSLAAQQQATDAEIDAKELVWEAWRAVSEQYYDAEFGGVDWPALGGDYLSRSYDSVDAAHAAIREILAKLKDPATRYLEPQQATALLAEFDGNLGDGIGLIEVLSLDTNEKTGELVVVTPVPNTPAASAGLETGDVILSVDGRETSDMGLAATMSALRGPAGDAVRVVLSRKGEMKETSILREHLGRVVSVEGSVRRLDDVTIGYIGLRLFNQGAADRLLTAVKDMEAQDVDAYILDLRNNPGGYVATLQRVAGAFLGSAPLASLKVRGGLQTLAATGGRLTDAPVVVLVNEGTASAAEVLASALQYHGRAVILGVNTFGKGLAHGLAPLSDGSAVMQTVGRLVMLDGVDILEQGIRPDAEVRSSTHPVVDPGVEVGGGRDVQFMEAVRRLRDEFRTR